MEQEILLDSNVIRRLIENNSVTINAIKSMQKDGYLFRITDTSLCELLSNDDTPKYFHKLVPILQDFDIAPVFRTTIPDFKEKYLSWFRTPKNIDEMLSDVFPSFSFNMSNFLSNLSRGIIIFLSNSLSKSPESNFYLFFDNFLDQQDYIDRYEKILESCYIDKTEKLHDYIEKEFKNSVLIVLALYNLFNKQNTFNQLKFNQEFENLKEVYPTQSFKDICSNLIKKDAIIIAPDSNMDELDLNFITEYFKGVLCENANFDLNDLTDYQNLKVAYTNNFQYYTEDKKAFNKYKRYLKNSDISRYIDEAKNFKDKYMHS